MFIDSAVDESKSLFQQRMLKEKCINKGKYSRYLYLLTFLEVSTTEVRNRWLVFNYTLVKTLPLT